jgi:hypothetical protein
MKAFATATRRTQRGVAGAVLAGAVVLAAAAPMAASILLAAPATAAEQAKPASPQWQEILALQLHETYNCVFDKVLFMRELKVGESVSIEGRARCIDAREYDFSRDRAHEKFTLRLCQPTVC